MASLSWDEFLHQVTPGANCGLLLPFREECGLPPVRFRWDYEVKPEGNIKLQMEFNDGHIETELFKEHKEVFKFLIYVK